MALSDQQHKAAVAMFGEDFVAGMINDAQNRTVELEKAGVAHKGAEETETETEVPEVAQDAPAETEEKQPDQPAQVAMTQDQFELLAGAVAERFTVNNEAIVSAMGAMAQNLQEMGDRVGELESKGKAQDKAEMPTYVFDLQRASQDERTTVTDDDDLKNQKPAESKGAHGRKANGNDTQTVTPDEFFETP